MFTPLHGPADADHYRVKVGRYGDRWYTDPLTGCDIAPASDWQGPSVSATKPPFANKYVPMRSIAEMSDEQWRHLAGESPETRYEQIKAHDRSAGRVNMDRGTIVHLWAEDLIAGRPMRDPIGYGREAVEQAEQFKSALVSFFDTHQPEPVAVEAVCLNRTLNGVGYGGTADLFARINGSDWVVDWKSRTSDHGAYLEEGAQGGAYLGAEYMIVTGTDGEPKRAPIPDCEGVLIVSITRDGFRCYPIDRQGAIDTYQSMHAWWVAQRDFRDNKVIGRPWAPKAAPAPEPADRENLRARISEMIGFGYEDVVRRLWPAGVPALSQDGHTDDQLAAILAAVRKAETEVGATFHPDDAPAPPEPKPSKPQPVVEVKPDDSELAADAQVGAIATAFGLLNADQLEAIKRIAEQANTAGRSISVSQVPSVRRCRIARALMGWATGDADEHALFVAATLIATDSQTADADQTLGALIGSFTPEQAEQLAETFSAAPAAA